MKKTPDGSKTGMRVKGIDLEAMLRRLRHKKLELTSIVDDMNKQMKDVMDKLSKNRGQDQKVLELRRRKYNLEPALLDLKRQLKVVNFEIDEVMGQIKNMTPATLAISEHVVLRYAERHYGVDAEKIRAEILAKVGPLVSKIGNAEAGGFVIKNNVVVTYKGEL
jgi:predicted  nucleic acid-binding Zn-ribbon protein